MGNSVRSAVEKVEENLAAVVFASPPGVVPAQLIHIDADILEPQTSDRRDTIFRIIAFTTRSRSGGHSAWDAILSAAAGGNLTRMGHRVPDPGK